MSDEPAIGDAFGEAMKAALAEQSGGGPRPTIGGRIPVPVVELIERDDGFLSAMPAARYFCGRELWQPFEQRAVDRLDGRTLDVGVGPGRFAVVLQERGVPVTGLDVSPGTLEVAAARGVRDLVCATVDDHARAVGARYDSFGLFGNNLGLLGSRERAPEFLAALAALARPGARIVAQGTDPYGTADEVHLAYHRRNQARGRLAGQLRLRVRHRDLATHWFDFLLASPGELAELVAASAWRIEEIDDGDLPFYVAILRLR